MSKLFLFFFILFCTDILYSQITGIKINGDTCSSLTIDLQVLGTSNSPYFFWNFGDPSSGSNDTITITGSSAQAFPTHTFSSQGVYTVCVSFQEPGFAISTVCRTISIGLCCDGIIASSDTCLQSSIPFQVITSASITNIIWDFGDPASGASNTSQALTPTHIFSSPGTYNITALATAACGTFQVNDQIVIVNCSNLCSGSIVSTNLCLTDETSFQIISNNQIVSVMWDFDDPASGLNNESSVLTPIHVFSSAGIYSIHAIVNFSCGTDTLNYTIAIVNCDSTPSDCKIFVPNVFTPNNDGLNDDFFPITECDFEHYELLIFNRWGNLLFVSKDINQKWNGKFNSTSCTDSVYIYLINYKFESQPKRNEFGTVTLLNLGSNHPH